MALPLPLTIGIEEEYQLIDPETRDLAPMASAVLAEAPAYLTRLLNPELHQAMIEIGTPPAENIRQAYRFLRDMRRVVAELAGRHGVRIVAAGTHPFALWENVPITEKVRYQELLGEFQDAVRALLIFGTHVHVGVGEDLEFRIDAMNVLRYMLPHLLALTVSSPLWRGRRTGFKSYRSLIWRGLPRTGIPVVFDSYPAYRRFVEVLVETGSIPDASRIWWAIRPHHAYPTLEFRAFDLATNPMDVIAVAALAQALVYKHYRMRQDNITFRIYPTPMIEENLWRAARYGLEGKLIDFGERREKWARDLIAELVAFVDEVLDELDARWAVEHVFRILDRGTSADRQLAIFEETGDARAVVDWLVEETLNFSEAGPVGGV